ncbi:transposase [Corynebacterium flavescens]|uniref:transposase n=1 Tax=Corynebacterium flavescens TaxID=28028 RepID=UPI00406CE13E
MAISPYDQETRQRAVRLYFEELTGGASTKAAALRAVEAVIGIKASTIRNWVRAEEKKVDVAVEQSDAEKDAELATLRKENARLKEANEILKLASAFFAQAELDRKLK